MKTEEGIIIETDGVTAKIKVGRHVECKDCGACPGSDAAIVTVRNTINALVGQRVLFEVKDEGALKGAFLIFVFPLLALFIGLFLGGIAAAYLSVNNVTGRIVGAVVFLSAALVGIIIFDRRIGKNRDALPIVTRIVV